MTPVHAGLSWGIYFMAYNSAKQRWQRRRKVAHLPPQLHLLSAAEAGCLVRRHSPFYETQHVHLHK